MLAPDSLDTIRYRIIANRRKLVSIALPHGGYRSYGDKVERDLAVQAAIVSEQQATSRVVIVIEGKSNVIVRRATASSVGVQCGS